MLNGEQQFSACSTHWVHPAVRRQVARTLRRSRLALLSLRRTGSAFIVASVVSAGLAVPVLALSQSPAAASSGGGSSWSVVSIPGGLAILNSVSCPSSTECVAAGKTVGGAGAVIETRDGGATWSMDGLPSG
ncbi:MAG: hypothetical protein ACYDBS_12040, partial [Acidimicrobiales bacterium]